MKKKTLSFLLALMMVSLALPLTASALTTNDAAAWMDAHEGECLDFDGEYGGQCTDVPTSYCDELFDWWPGGNARDYWSYDLPQGWERIDYAPGLYPQPGDIVVFEPSYSGAILIGDVGHVGLVYTVYDDHMVTMEQNAGEGDPYAMGTYMHKCERGYEGLWGFIRPPFTDNGGNFITEVQPVEVHFARANPYRQGQFTDVPAGEWYAASVADAFELGLMKGNGETTFNPHGDVTVAEAVTMACRIHAIFTTGSDSAIPTETQFAWYQPYLDYAWEKGIYDANAEGIDVNQKATRAQCARIFAKALPREALSAVNEIADGKIPDVPMSAPYAGAVYQLYRAGILSGGDAQGTFSPDSFITRKEAAAILSRMAESNARRSFAL